MKALKIIGIVLVVIIGGYFIWQSTLPADYQVERSTVVDTDPATAYTYVSDFKTWPEWSAWFKRDSTMKAEWGEKTVGEGADYKWVSANSGNGHQSITGAVENESLATQISFEGMGESDGYWKFEATEDGKTKITWGFTGTFPLYIRFMGKHMDANVGPDFEEGLEGIKGKLEAMPKEVAIEINEEMVETIEYYGISSEVEMKNIGAFLGASYGEIMTYLGEDAMNMKSPPMAIYSTWDEETGTTNMTAAIAATSDLKGTDKIIKSSNQTGLTLMAAFYGPYEQTGAVHGAIHERVATSEYEIIGAPWEVYVTDPMSEPDTSKWLTKVYYPVSKGGTESAE